MFSLHITLGQKVTAPASLHWIRRPQSWIRYSGCPWDLNLKSVQKGVSISHILLHNEGGDTAQWVRTRLLKHENPNEASQLPYTKPGMAFPYMPVTQELGRSTWGGRRSTGTCWPTAPLQIQERPCLKGTRKGLVAGHLTSFNYALAHTILCGFVYWYTYACVCMHAHMCTHKHVTLQYPLAVLDTSQNT